MVCACGFCVGGCECVGLWRWLLGFCEVLAVCDVVAGGGVSVCSGVALLW